MNEIIGTFLFAVGGFFCGSVMFSYLIAKIFFKVDIIEKGSDHNPGTTNVLRCVGTVPGVVCLVLDVAKAAVPVFVARQVLPMESRWFALVVAAPVLGHAFSPMLKGKGGKAIAASFGAFLAVSSVGQPVVLYLALLLMFFSVVIVIKPDSLRVMVCMLAFVPLCYALPAPRCAGLAALLVAATVIFKHITNYGDEKAQVRLLFEKKK
ncbi:MAG: glycerol-3-phosphate acyltransferase [Oscillospiraceae bacterium]|jgi:glycerol-3-phosphate acyltransferase PlsY|nr:glycerol-3-phosphate acyltransferase [Oscillospiraceae bacterium]